jgi:hypothetical protein
MCLKLNTLPPDQMFLHTSAAPQCRRERCGVTLLFPGVPLNPLDLARAKTDSAALGKAFLKQKDPPPGT